MSDPFKLKRWRPERERTPFASLLLASRNSGKSHLIRTLWEKVWKTRFRFVVVFCGSDHDESYPDFLPGRMFFKKFRPDVVQRLKQMNEDRTAGGLDQLPVLFILDDCSESRERYDEDLRSLYTRGRHWAFSVVFATQGIQLSDTVARNNSDLFCSACSAAPEAVRWPSKTSSRGCRRPGTCRWSLRPAALRRG